MSLDRRLQHVQEGLDIIEDPAKELAFAILAVDVEDPATLDWLAICAVERAAELRFGHVRSDGDA